MKLSTEVILMLALAVIMALGVYFVVQTFMGGITLMDAQLFTYKPQPAPVYIEGKPSYTLDLGIKNPNPESIKIDAIRVVVEWRDGTVEEYTLTETQRQVVQLADVRWISADTVAEGGGSVRIAMIVRSTVEPVVNAMNKVTITVSFTAIETGQQGETNAVEIKLN